MGKVGHRVMVSNLLTQSLNPGYRYLRVRLQAVYLGLCFHSDCLRVRHNLLQILCDLRRRNID
jgi:hypothetical protein